MIANPVQNSYYFALPRDFIYESVRSQIGDFYKYNSLPFADVVDYLNSTITSAKIPGISDAGTVEQIEAVTHRSRTFPSPLPSKDGQTKQLDITFKLKANYINWFILRRQFEEYQDGRKKPENKGKVFMPPIHLFILDEEDNILYDIVYREIQWRKISDIRLSKTDNGIGTKEFDITLAYNDWDMKINTQLQSTRADKDHVYNKFTY